MLKSLRTRLFITYFLLIILILGILGTTFVFFVFRNPMSYRDAVIDLRASAQAIDFRAPNFPNQPADFVSRLDRVADDFEVRVIHFSLDLKVLYDTNPENSLKFPASRVRPLPHGRVETFIDENELTYLYNVIRLPEKGFFVSVVERPTLPLEAIFEEDMIQQLIQAGLISILFSFVLAFLMGRWITRPLNEMKTHFEKIAGGEAGDLQLKGPAEFEEFSNRFNEMTEKVAASQRSQRDFVANVSHELKTPLTSIQGFSQAILDGTVQNEDDLKKSASIIYDEAGRMHRMVIDLLDLAKFDAGTVEMMRTPLDIGALLNSVLDKFGPIAAGHQVRLERNIEEIPLIVGDGDRLAQVFTNIVDNAIKFTKAGGVVFTSASVRNGLIEVSIHDHGPGIEQDQIVRLFERFYQLDKARVGGKSRGAGLGLAIAQQIVQAHLGEITVRSEKGKGSEFVIRFPVVLSTDETIAMDRSEL